MPLTAQDLLTPRGRLNGAALWPGVSAEEVDETLGTYLDEGYAKPEVAALAVGDRDDPARLWAYHRAYQEAYERLLLTPSTVNTSDQGGSSFLLTQIEHVGELAVAALAEFNDAVGEAADSGSDWPVIMTLR